MIASTLLVHGNSRFLNTMYIKDIVVSGTSTFASISASSISSTGTLSATGATTLSSTLSVTGAATMSNDLTVSGTGIFSRTTNPSGTTNTLGALVVGGTATSAHLAMGKDRI